MSDGKITIARYAGCLMTWVAAANRGSAECLEMDDALSRLRLRFGDDACERPQVFCMFMESVGDWPIDLYKSSLLARMIYGGEKLRTRMCPVHKGHWTRPSYDDSCGCSGGGFFTGWLREDA